MVLNKIFKPILTPFTKNKWQSRNPEVRRKGVQELPVSDQDTLHDIAMNDEDDSIRALAASKLSDLDHLQTIIMKGTNEAVKQAAQNRLFQLLCGLKHPIPDYDIREKMIRGSRNPALLEFVATHAEQAELREITIKRINRDPLLGDIALTDGNAKIRQLAAQQIAKRSTLERVAKKSRSKDKRVYKIVKTKLDCIIEDEDRPILLAKEVLDICDKLEKLLKRNRLLQEKTTFENFVTRWSEIQNFASKETTERYQNIRSTITENINALEQEQCKQQETIQTLELFLSNLSMAIDDLLNAKENEEADKKFIEEKEKIILNLGQEWDEVIKSLHVEKTISSYNAKFQAILDLADTHTEPQTTSNNLEKIQSLLDQAELMLNKTGYIPEKTISALHNKFQQQIKNNQYSEIDVLEERFNSALKILNERLSIQQQSAKEFIAQINAQTDKIKTMIAEGHVSKADKSLHKLFKQIDNSVLLSSSEKLNYHSQLKDIQSELGDLSSWRNWAHDKERENLALKVEQLAEQTKNNKNLATEFSDITSQIKEFRQQWKKMRSHTQEEIWQRFNNACNEAYEQCTPFIDKQTEFRQSNLKAKQALCEQLENYISSMGWPTPEEAQINNTIDWIQVEKITKQARKEWSAIGFVERKEHKNISKRFDKAIDTIRQELKKVWYINQEQFNKLIENVQDLIELIDDDLPTAINKAKGYQAQWKKIGPVSSFQRNKLWKKFRTACDVIFDKRQENIEQKNSQNTEHLREKEAICENLEALNQQPLSRSDLDNAFNDIHQLWKELAPLAKSISTEVNKRYDSALGAYKDKVSALIVQEQEHQLQSIKEKADICTKIEATTEVVDDTIDQFNVQWSQVSLPNSFSAPLNKRFENALLFIDKDKEALKQVELKTKQQFCLKHEILLGKDSPEADHQARMEMQVELLNSNLGQNRSESSDNNNSAFELQLRWYALSNYTQDNSLEERFKALLQEHSGE